MNDYITLNGSKNLVVPTAWTTNGIAVKYFPEHTVLLKKECFEGFLNRCKIDWMVNDNSSSCNPKCIFKKLKKMICNI